jgi:RimJ/RimL family protein N-acetyltransferase
MTAERPAISLMPGRDVDLPLFRRLLGDPSMSEDLGGPETPEKIANRLARSVADPTRLFKVVVDGQDVGFAGYWERSWRDEEIFELGWSVLPAHQGRGIAKQAAAHAAGFACAETPERLVHAFPNVDNAASNALCKGAGFTLLGPCLFEYPPGHTMECNDWAKGCTRFGWVPATP